MIWIQLGIKTHTLKEWLLCKVDTKITRLEQRKQLETGYKYIYTTLRHF